MRGRRDRAAACDGRTIVRLGPEEVDVAGRPGVLVGFSLVDAEGDVTDMTRSWGVADGTTVAWVTVNAADAEACVPEAELSVPPALLDRRTASLGQVVAGARAPMLS